MLCGGCAASLPKKTPIQVIELGGVKRKHFRGPCCADSAPPAEIDEGPTDRELIEERVESIKSIGARVIHEWLPHPDD